MNIGFIGLGTMGYPMAGHLSKAGYHVGVFNRNPKKVEKWRSEYKGTHYSSIIELTKNSDLVLTCVGNDDDVKEVYFGRDGIIFNLREDAKIIDHTTTSSVLAREIFNACQANGNEFIDAPVSGGEAGAIKGQLAVMAGGNETTFKECLEVINCYSKKVVYIGGAGSGQLCKMANQLCIAGTLQGLSEALILTEASKLDVDAVVSVLNGGAAASWQLDNRAETMNQRKFDFGFAIDWMRKDLAFCLEEAKSHNITLPCATHVDSQYEKLQGIGENRSDTSVLIKQFEY